MASSMEAWNTPICCCNWVLNCVPGISQALTQFFCCKAVSGVGGTVLAGVFKDSASKRKD